jgi:hypothetical protein
MVSVAHSVGTRRRPVLVSRAELQLAFTVLGDRLAEGES